MKKTLIVTMLICAYYVVNAQQERNGNIDPVKEILTFQRELDEQFKDTAESPLPDEDALKFTGHTFFPFDLKYRVLADLLLTPDAPAFEMPTTTARKPLYKKYAIAFFTIDSIEYHLSLYQSLSLIEKEGYKDYLFLPYKDYTNGFETYGGGRYIDLKLTEGDKIIIDFNQSYNPYCAYSDRYSCPIPPDENSLPLRIEAGVMHEEH